MDALQWVEFVGAGFGTRRAMNGGMTKTERAQRKAEIAASAARIQAAREETRRIVAEGCCPQCGRGLKRNSSITGWWQCEQFGAESFRKDPTAPSCSWQGFTE